jgi:fatty acid desaturase
MSAKRPFFRHGAIDVIPALGGVGHFAFLLFTFLAYPWLPAWAVVVCFLTYATLICWNLQCISHNFIHNPFFAFRPLNRIYGVIESLAIGMPHQLYHHYHLNHHAGDNDRKGPDGTTRDWSSIYRYGKDDKPESFLRYCLISFFRVEVAPVLRVAARHGWANLYQVGAETLAIAVMWGVMAWVNPYYFALFYLPSYFLGWVFSYAEGYLEHYGAEPGNPFANSVSSYHWLYNVLWLNNGYHQEHHWDPKYHWSRMPELHRQIRPQLEANHTRTLHGPHMTALIEDLFTRQKPVAPTAPSQEEPLRRVA